MYSITSRSTFAKFEYLCNQDRHLYSYFGFFEVELNCSIGAMHSQRDWTWAIDSSQKAVHWSVSQAWDGLSPSLSGPFFISLCFSLRCKLSSPLMWAPDGPSALRYSSSLDCLLHETK